MLKKTFLTIFSLCLVSVCPALAQGNDLDGRCFTISNQNSDNRNAFMQDDWDCDKVIEAWQENEYSFWKFISTGNEDCYYIQNVCTGRYIQGHGNVAEVEVMVGLAPAEYCVKASTGYPGSYGFSSTAATVHDFSANCIGLNLKGNETGNFSYIQTYAAVDGNNPRSFWVLTEVNEEDIKIPQVVEPEDLTGVSEEELYHNPIIRDTVPDPTVIRGDDGYFYVYATEGKHNMPIYRSLDLVDWEFVGTVFTDETRPTFIDTDRKKSLWAPDINKIGDRYVLYYADWDSVWNCGIGIAVADKPEGPFTDLGKLFTSSEMNAQNSIDVFYIEDEGNKYIFWGSFAGIWYTQLTDDGLGLKDGMTCTKVAGSLAEGTCMVKHDGYYYMIVSAGTCCDGVDSTYRLLVARSESLFGPYVNRVGLPAESNNWSKLLAKSMDVRGPGHCSEVFEDDAGNTWMVYHGYNAETGEGRYLYLDRVYWDEEGWPCMADMQPTAVARRPVINTEVERVEQVANDGGLSISPRRVQDSLEITLPKADKFSWQVVNTHGELLQQGTGQGTATVNMTSAPIGLYIVTVQSGKKSYSDKVIKY